MPSVNSYHFVMKQKSPRDILAANMLKMIDREGLSIRAWASGKGLDVRMIDRMTKSANAFTIDSLDEVAKKCGLQAWQLLVEDGIDMDAGKPPMSDDDRELLDRLKRLLV